MAVNKILIAEENGAKCGQFAAADLTGYLKGKEADVHDIAAITSTPPHYLLGSMVNLSAEALKAAEAGLIHKIYQRRRFLEEGLERTMRLAGSPRRRRASSAEPRSTEGELVDALVKMSTLGVPRGVLWRRWGATPQEIERWRQLNEDALDRAMSGDLAAEYGPKPGASEQPVDWSRRVRPWRPHGRLRFATTAANSVTPAGPPTRCRSCGACSTSAS